ncbi:SulA-like leucine-rich domain-containing protein [Catenovulum sp. 2E275]|uniref:SulA-like leucine-rich domain-containing protein n=1 Tax=Catenovulum sp. 2E275 TaxID=2980497 RepID=UPI0021D35A35|nr:SulA-like leucine-rich domain-containing protein [Catenovulum sp. 2E275]MCU4676173.1 SulA-like leucine-rich domain-containing protein [Catenovulum sp. 2E275]
MNTYILTDAVNKTRFFSTNSNTNEFEMRFWQAIARLQESNRWLCVVAPKRMPNKQLLTEAGIELNRMLVIHTHAGDDVAKITQKALKLGKCCAVVAWFDQLDKQERETIINTAADSKAACVMVKPTYVGINNTKSTIKVA